MAEKIKSFFQRKIKDEKFKLAGKGHKLNETNNLQSATTSKTTDAPKRHEPTVEAQIAGQAALARLEKGKKSTPKLNTSYAAIQARVKRELEQERLALANQNVKENIQSNDVSKGTESTEEAVHESYLLAVNGVYYRCPLISDEVLEKETWYEKIQEFLSNQLSDGEDSLSACLIIHSCNDGKEKINQCVQILCKYLDNIQSNPDESKYWKIRMSNKIFQEKVKPLRGAMEFLKAAGFTQEKLMHQDKEEDFLVWSPDRSSVNDLTMLIDALSSAETVPLELDRNTQVLLPNQADKRRELPAEFFMLTSEDIKREQMEKLKLVERNQMLMTQAMREKFMKEKERRYHFTIIRIRFPDNIILQGTFATTENYENVVKFVKENLFDQEFPFYLITDTREKLSEADFEKTLESLHLVPAVVLTFYWNTSSNPKTPSRYLKDETYSLLQSM